MLREIEKMPALVVLLFLLGVAVPSSGQQTTDGKRIFASTCAGCHGLDGKGSERGPDIGNRRTVQLLSNASLAQIIRDGKPGTGMPPFRSLGEPRIEAVVRHLRTLQGGGTPAALPGDPIAGKSAFFGKAECSSCHMTNGRGGFIGPDLSAYAAGKTQDDVRIAITDPNKNLDPRKRTVVVKTADGTVFTGVARNEDNFSLQLQTADGAFHFLTKSELESLDHRSESLMPGDYGSRLTHLEVDDLISYLMSIAQNHAEEETEKE